MGKHTKEYKKKLERQKKIKKGIALGAVGVVAVVVLGFFGWQALFGPPSGATVVATIDGVNITADDVTPLIRQAEWSLSQDNPEIFIPGEDIDYNAEFEDGLTIGEAIRQEAVRMAARNVLMMREAERLGVELSDEDLENIETQIASTRDHFNAQSPIGFTGELRAAGFRNEQHVRGNFQSGELTRLALDAIIENPEEFARFEEYMEEIEEDESDGDDATARANEILARARAGEDFDMLIATYGEDPGMQASPQGYTFGPGEMVPEFEQGTRDLAIGEIGMVRSQFGYHIIQRIEPNPADARNPDAPEDELLGAKHVLIGTGDDTPPPPTLEERKAQAVIDGFEALAETLEIVFHNVLNRIRVEPQ